MNHRFIRIAAGMLSIALLLGAASCGEEPGEQTMTVSSQASSSPVSSQEEQESEAETLLGLLEGVSLEREVTEDFLAWCGETQDAGFLSKMIASISQDGYADTLWFTHSGRTLHVLQDLYTNAAETADNLHIKSDRYEGPVTLTFTGDVNLADNWSLMRNCKKQANGLLDCLSADLLAEMNAADVMLINNEFVLSDGGEPLKDKRYRFKAAPENVEMLKTMGADIVSVANNHVFDYCEEGLYDTLATLTEAGIPYVGGGKDLEEAMQPQYFIVGGQKIAYVAASRAREHNFSGPTPVQQIFTQAATETQPGVLHNYDSTLFLQCIEEAAKNSDYVIAYPHWGTENTHEIEQEQKELARQYIDAGVDAIIGSHPHCLQGIEFYQGKPIVYSLGNFWFNMKKIETGMIRLTLDGETVTTEFLPCMQENGETTLLTEGETRDAVIALMEKISVNAEIAPDGTVREKAAA